MTKGSASPLAGDLMCVACSGRLWNWAMRPTKASIMTSVKDFVEHARRKLVDTSMRNRLLNYVSGKRSAAVEVVGEQPAAIWDALVVKNSRLQFRGIGIKKAGGDGSALEVDDSLEETGPAEAGYFYAELTERFEPQHVDEFLDTRIQDDVLDTKLRRLADTARASLEEQGVATLFLALGFLHFYEEESSARERAAPLLLVPVVLARAKADKWAVRVGEDEPLVNPALVEYLRSQHRLEVAEIAEEGFKPTEWLSSMQALVATHPRWRVSAACLLGNFSFQKFVMHEDLKRNAAAVIAHPVIEQLARRTGESAALSTLPPEIRDRDLDATFAPEATFQVVDADSTQQRALAAVATGKNLVIQGPPGTGKSQTITNLISGALAEGKTVLFVAEKQAALNVVFDRLRKAGLGDFCLELHSSKANKKELLAELKRAWDASSAAAAPEPSARPELARARGALTAYTKAMHGTVQPLGLSPFAVMGRLLRLERAPELRVTIEIQGVTRQALEEIGTTLDELTASAQRLGSAPADHPWNGSIRQRLSLEQRDELFAALDRLRPLLQSISAEAKIVDARFGLHIESLETAAVQLAELHALLASAPGIPLSLGGEWNGSRALQVIERGKALLENEVRTRGVLLPETRVEDLKASVALIAARGRSIWAWLSGAWRAARRRLKAATPPGSWLGAFSAAQKIADLLHARAERAAIDAEAAGQASFGRLWRGADSDWIALGNAVKWGQAFRAAASRLALRPSAYAADAVVLDASLLRELAARIVEACALWGTICRAGEWPADYLKHATVVELAERVELLHMGRDRWREMGSYQAALASARETPARALVEAALNTVHVSSLRSAFERRFFAVWLDELESTERAIGRFDGEEHSRKISDFRLLDKQALEINKQRTAIRLRQRTQDHLKGALEETKFLRDQMARMRGHKPVRQLVQRGHRAIQAIKPCFLMSPMTVAQMLDPAHPFDIVIFDEASQLTCEDALGAIVRGRQLVVVGDPKQLPPTNFFSAQLGEVEVDIGEDGQQKFDDLESILELAQAAGFHGAQLRWHYRSRHESLIAYSNQNFYDASLLTFPSVDRTVGHFGLGFEYVADGRYEGKGPNSKEAATVVAAVVRHAHEHPTRSLCVGTFSLPQQLRIQDLLERERRLDPQLEGFLALDKAEPFFVKNLESIQGDERDVVFLSVTYGPAADGKIRYNFGPLSGQSGWRRLNVLTTRAREQMRVFSSMRADDMTVSREMRGAVLLRDFIKYAETGVLLAGPLVSAAAEVDSPFEEEVLHALTAHGVELVPQVGVAGYRIDFGVVDAELPGRFVCGIECDGAAYHSAESARDRDRLREEVLRGLGWELHRLWSTDWWHDRKKQTERLARLIEESRQKVKSAKHASPPGANAAPTTSPPAAVPARTPPLSSRPPARALAIPTFAPYCVTVLPRQTGELVNASASTIGSLCRIVLEKEGPVHEEDLQDRLMDAFGHKRAGTKIVERLTGAFAAFQTAPGITRVEAWWSLPDRPILPRHRGGMASSPDRIAPAEYSVAVQCALDANGALADEELVGVLREALGFNSATAKLKSEVATAVRGLLDAGALLHVSGGYALRR